MRTKALWFLILFLGIYGLIVVATQRTFIGGRLTGSTMIHDWAAVSIGMAHISLAVGLIGIVAGNSPGDRIKLKWALGGLTLFLVFIAVGTILARRDARIKGAERQRRFQERENQHDPKRFELEWKHRMEELRRQPRRSDPP